MPEPSNRVPGRVLQGLSSSGKDTSTGALQTPSHCHSPRGPALSDPHAPLFSTSPYKPSSWPQCAVLWVLPEPHFLPSPLPPVVSCFRSGQHGGFWGHGGGPKAKPALSASSDLGVRTPGGRGTTKSDHKVCGWNPAALAKGQGRWALGWGSWGYWDKVEVLSQETSVAIRGLQVSVTLPALPPPPVPEPGSLSLPRPCVRTQCCNELTWVLTAK